ncbi:hypothetical protein [Desulfosporosinus hippei]|uniref:Uncharacterized protein n=1 Tax=Desulfosporosinus hippei DSM 8344 TaxID=1121419 RepID=A0A1G8AUJ7_9FIRM|nr:hypothetical protein [Desulfosporosinus hippei]SDH24567.1 hypothetical protein SAMN05443529_111123 [Desulfosporosinus hippei DSM 8344]
MLLKILPYFLFGITAFLTISSYVFLSRFTQITKDKIVGITVALSSIPCCLAVLVMVFKVNSQPDWPWVIIAILPLIAYYFVPIWYKRVIIPQLELIETKNRNKKTKK